MEVYGSFLERFNCGRNLLLISYAISRRKIAAIRCVSEEINEGNRSSMASFFVGMLADAAEEALYEGFFVGLDVDLNFGRTLVEKDD